MNSEKLYPGHQDFSSLSRSDKEAVLQIRSLCSKFRKIQEEYRKRRLDYPLTIVKDGRLYVSFDNLYELQSIVVDYSNWLLGKYDAALARCRFFSPRAKQSVRSLVSSGLISPQDVVSALLMEDGFSADNYIINTLF